MRSTDIARGVERAFAAEQAQQTYRVALFRFCGATAFLGLFFVLGVVLHLDAWSVNLRLFLAYAVAAGALLAAARGGARFRAASSIAFGLLDMPAIYLIQLSTFPHSNANGVAGFNLGIYVFLLLLAALTLDRTALVFTAAIGVVLEGRLQYLAGVDRGAIVAAAMLLSLTAVGCAYARARVVDLVRRLAAHAEHEQMLRELARKTREQSYLDPLTGAYNRAGFLDLGERHLASAASAAVPYVVVFVDLDGLKVINDELGHAQGDDAIQATASVLRATLRETDLVARLGGDEFVVLAADPQGTSDGGARIIERIVLGMNQFNESSERPYLLHVSAGAAPFVPAEPRPLPELLGEADAAMYAQKKTRPSRRQAQVLRAPPSAVAVA